MRGRSEKRKEAVFQYSLFRITASDKADRYKLLPLTAASGRATASTDIAATCLLCLVAAVVAHWRRGVSHSLFFKAFY